MVSRKTRKDKIIESNLSLGAQLRRKVSLRHNKKQAFPYSDFFGSIHFVPMAFGEKGIQKRKWKELSDNEARKLILKNQTAKQNRRKARQ